MLKRDEQKIRTPLSKTIICSCTSQNTNVQDLLGKGASSFQEGKFDSAIQYDNEALKVDPNNFVGYNLLGMAYRFKFNQTGTQEYKDKEIESFKKAIEFEPKYCSLLILPK